MSLRIPVGEGDHAQGRMDAQVVLVQYGDYQCPACGEAEPVARELRRQTGADLCFVFRNFPLGEAHPDAVAAAIVAEYAGRHGRFWEAHDALYANQDRLGEDLYVQIAQALRLPLDGLRDALAGGPEADRVEADFEGGVRSGVNGTPCFFINGRIFQVEASFEELSDAVQSLLRGG